ncbi:Nucleoside diphosphate-linked moiety X motif 19, mitochondrial [Perkinsus olseni]|uniref:Nucleoside diphosphate-linked moiety X motif 19, mitochondrial n=1 Tax=Perkinsus olseni TaxID=32597 RepID=A0A7J6NG64_PEROL|nr:Nucleoside diphosphate-linked moiety X motif 19, mitochondrial [Perkinsus olseni]KAF4719477.1 Nucleoside diphosphate-linked moiety X motif 19, mitochondrial [Perkinsus olseni]
MSRPRWSQSASILLFLGDKICMVRRSGSSRFMPHALVFPGGKLEEDDEKWAREYPAGRTNRCCCSRCNPGDVTDLSFRRCALRELKEETSIELDVSEAVSRMVYLCQFQTPDYEAAKTKKGGFITRFYVYALESDSRTAQSVRAAAMSDGRETTQLVWRSPSQILKEYEASGGIMLLPPPQWHTLTMLQNAASLGPEAIAAQARRLSRSYFRYPIKPRPIPGISTPSRIILAYPGDCQHDIYKPMDPKWKFRFTYYTGKPSKDWRPNSVEISPELSATLESEDVPEFCTKHVLPFSSL